MSVFSFIVLLPLNFTGGGHANASDLKGYVGSLLFTDFLRFTMANVSGGSPRLWVHCFAAYLLTGIVIRELLVEYEAFHNIRHRYLLSREAHLRTVLVSNIPRHLRAPSKLDTYFRHVYPNAVKSVTMCENLIFLEQLIARRTSLLTRLEQELLLLCRAEKRKLYAQSKFHTWCTKHFGPDYYTNLLSCGCFNSNNTNICCCNCQSGRQERLTKLYIQLEDLNHAIEQEQRRRRRVMTKLDHMEAGEHGRKDIAYILASPFVQTDDQAAGLGYVPPPAAPAPSGSTQQEGKSTNTNIAKGNDATEGTPGEQGGSGSSSGGILRSRSPNPPGAEQDPQRSHQRHQQYHPHSHHADGIFRDEDWSKKGNKSSYTKARHAIKRYSKMARNVNFFGRPITTSYTPSEGILEEHVNEVTDKAFVVMRTFTASTIAIQSMHSSKPGSMQVTTAPEPRDILWENIYVSKGATRTRSYLGEALVLLLIGFYVIPIALISLLVSESALVSSSSRIAQLDQASAFFSSAIAMVQPLCVVALQQLLPPLFIAIGKAEGLVSFSEVQMRAFSRYFLFQVVNVFLVTTIAGSIFDTIAIIVDNPETMFEMLGNSLPRMSSFFITFVTIKTFFGLGVELVRTMSLAQSLMLYIVLPNATLRMKRTPFLGLRAIDDPGWFPFHKILAQDMLVVVISVVFAVVAPMVLLPCALFCLFSRIMWTHHHLYVYESVFETGGQFWPKIFRRFVFGLIIAQMTITGQFILKEARHEAYATIALIFMTYFFLRSTRARYDPASSTLPLEVATVMDISLSQEEESLRKAREHQYHAAAAAANAQATAATAEQEGKKETTSTSKKSTKKNTNNTTHNTILLESDRRTTTTTTTTTSIPESSDLDHDASSYLDSHHLGTRIGIHDPFEYAYIQPALRANPRARPEQPFPPSQLGRDILLHQHTTNHNGITTTNAGASTSTTTTTMSDDELRGSGATLRLKGMNQQDRRLVNRWWNDQLQKCASHSSIIPILIGEECGTLTIGQWRQHYHQQQQYQPQQPQNHHQDSNMNTANAGGGGGGIV